MQEQAVASFRPSPQQEELWLAEPDGPTGRNQLALLIEGNVSDVAMRKAVEDTVARHEILRTTFQRRPGMRVPLQIVHDQLAPAWELADAADLGDVLASEREHALDLENGPVLRCAFAQISPDRHALVVTVSPVTADGGSLATLARDVVAAYGGNGAAEAPLQYADYSEWQHELSASEDESAAEGRAYWLDAGAPSTPAVPFLFASERGGRTAEVTVSVSDGTLEKLADQAERYGVEAEVVVQTAWQVLLARLSGSEDVTVGTIASARPHVELETAVGVFARPVPVSVRVSEEVAFAEVVDQLARARTERASWQDYLPAAASRLDVGFVGVANGGPLSVDGTAFSVAHVSGDTRSFVLAAEWTGSVVRVVHDPDAFEPEHAERLARHLGRLLADVADDASKAVADLELLDDADLQLLRSFNPTSAPLSGKRVDDLIAEAAQSAADRSAVVDAAGSIAYAELDRRANQLAHRLRRAGAGPGTTVALCTDRSVEMVVGLVGILKTGAAYLPLNFEHPPARLAHQLEETGSVAIVTQERVLDRLPEAGGERVCLDRDRPQLDSEPATAVAGQGSAGDLVYVIYTSGSTGTPKGVGVTHANLVNYVEDITARVAADAEPLAFGMVTAISTDLGNTAVFPALCSGGTLVLVPPTVAADAAAFAAYDHEIDVLKITPSHLASLAAGPDAEFARLLPRRCLVTGGEAASWDLVARVRKVGSCKVLNHYGPTETTVGSCTYEVQNGPGAYRPGTVPIGRPIRNTSCYVLDSKLRPLPVGATGELYIGGAGVAQGYVGQAEETAKRFVADPFAESGSARMYATGDVARFLPDGTIEFLGRRDEQIKIRGFRVEPAEIETALRSHAAVREAIVVARDDGRGERRLVAYVVAGGVDAEDLKRHVGEWVPDFMVPSAFVVLDELPRTPSGKVDRLALPSPEDVAAGAGRTVVSPRTPIEEKVAAVWREVLGVEEVGVTDDFFAIGGHSLLATQIVARVRNEFAIDLPLHALFSSPTVETLSQSIVELLGEETDAETAALLDELESLSDEEAERLLAGGEGT